MKKNGFNIKRARIINAVVWLALAVVSCTMVTVEWYSQGCEINSLIIGNITYIVFSVGLGGVTDKTMREIANW